MTYFVSAIISWIVIFCHAQISRIVTFFFFVRNGPWSLMMKTVNPKRYMHTTWWNRAQANFFYKHLSPILSGSLPRSLSVLRLVPAFHVFSRIYIVRIFNSQSDLFQVRSQFRSWYSVFFSVSFVRFLHIWCPFSISSLTLDRTWLNTKTACILPYTAVCSTACCVPVVYFVSLKYCVSVSTHSVSRILPAEKYVSYRSVQQQCVITLFPRLVHGKIQ